MTGVCERCKLSERYKYWHELPPIKHKFYKIMLNGFEHQLTFPNKFIECFKGQLARECTLRGPSGNEWRVRIERTEEGEFVLSNGWENFVRDHGLNISDLLTFRYLGGSSFNVSIFDATGCEREGTHFAMNGKSCSYTSCTSALHCNGKGGFECLFELDEEPDQSMEGGGLPEQNSEGSSQELNVKRTRGRESNQSKSAKGKGESIEMPNSKAKKKRVPSYIDLDAFGNEGEEDNAKESSYGRDDEQGNCYRPNKRRGASSQAKQSQMYYISNRRAVTGKEKERAYSMAMRHMKSNKPSGGPMFAITLCKTNVYRGFHLTIPQEWALKHMLREPHEVELKVPDAMESWTVGCRWTPSQCQIRARWPRFVLENNLEEHDVCIFELALEGKSGGKRNPIFIVNIFRVIAETVPLTVSRTVV